MEKKVCIFCASSSRVGSEYQHHARDLTKLLIENKYEIVYGAGSVGLMGTVAETALQNNGKVTGIIPQFMVDMEWANKKISKLIVVKSMWERKEQMISNADAIIALAGGIGTLDELIEVITLKQLGQFTGPVIVLNTNNFYSFLLQQLDKMVHEGFMRESHAKLWHVAEHPWEVMIALNEIGDSEADIIYSAQV